MPIPSKVTNSVGTGLRGADPSLFQMSELGEKHHNGALVMGGNFSSYCCATSHYKLHGTY